MHCMDRDVQQSRSNDKLALVVKDLTPEGTKILNLGCFLHQSDNKVEEDMVSDCESCTTGSSFKENSSLFGSGIVRLDEEDALHKRISQKFMSDLAGYGMQTNIEAIHRKLYTSVSGHPKILTYLNFLSATEKKNNGDASWKYAWYCGSRQDINTTLSYGFGPTVNGGVYGRGIYLSPAHYPLQSVHLSTVDEDGLRHFLLCRVILGKMELVCPGSEQCHPSSEEFDSGVDNLLNPTKYIIWSTHMNTHILPEFVISIRVPPVTKGNKKFPIPQKKPTSPWMPLPTLISILSKYLAPESIKKIQKFHIDYKEGRIARQEMINQVRKITGDVLLIGVLKGYAEKLKTSKGSEPLKSSTKCQQHHGCDCGCSKERRF